jgi:YYY domain-containing protein
MNQESDELVPHAIKKPLSFPWWMILFFIILSIGAYFRVVGIDWAGEYHMHPDERFLTMVESAIAPTTIKEYFDTSISSMNPHNRGYTFYVYGTFPLFIVRYAGMFLQQSGYGEIYLVGRYLSALFDLMTIALVFLIADRLFRKMLINLLAAAFYAAAVLPIQLSHYFIVDSFANFFTILTLYFAVRIMSSPLPWSLKALEGGITEWFFRHSQGIWVYIFFGLAFGMAMASKVSTFLVVMLLPLAILVQLRRFDEELDRDKILLILRNLVIAALFSFLTFRILQPYAFNGPSFFNFGINQDWINSLKDLASQSTGNSDAPPALQWARRPLTFSWENMVMWGFGLPLGLLAWAGFLGMTWQVLKRDWKPYLLIWLWTGGYFLYQSMQFSRTMRYQIHVYPTLAIMAAWCVYQLWQLSRKQNVRWKQAINRSLFWLISVGVLLSTLLWALAFVQIYRDPFTREEASEWIYQNVPTAVNLELESEDGRYIQHLPYALGELVDSDTPFSMVFTPHYAAPVSTIQIDHVLGLPTTDIEHVLLVEISENTQDSSPVLSGQISQTFMRTDDPRGGRYQIAMNVLDVLSPDKEYRLTLSTPDPTIGIQLAGSIAIGYSLEKGIDYQYLPELVNTLAPGEEYRKLFTPHIDGWLTGILIPHVLDYEASPEAKNLSFQIVDHTVDSSVLVDLPFASFFHALDDPRGEPVHITLDEALPVQKSHTYELVVKHESAAGRLAFYGSKKADESSWDDVVPLNMYGYNAFDYYEGLYRTDLNFEMYWADNEEKRLRFYEILDQTDYIFITSNRQWGTTVRVPERYPLTSTFYRSLIGCPEDKDILWCYRVAQPGMFESALGFELVKVSQSNPHLGDFLSINTQFAEEAFTVYDHPKVMIFKKTNTYQPSLSRQIFGAVDLSKVIHLTPREASVGKAGNQPALDLMLPAETWQAQQAAGTWSELFNPNVSYNRYPILAVLVWYLSVLVLGWIVFPFVHLAFPAYKFNGYPFAKLIGLLFLALGSWWLSSNGLEYSKTTIGLVLLGLVLLNGLIFFIRRHTFLQALKHNWKSMLMIEGIMLAFFVFFLLVRIGNPDLWHPAKGGEKPMDFSYFNAILKTQSFPPYDPWFAGGYINYYYYGFVLVGTLVKFLGIIPSIAYNLILPSLYSMAAIGAFSIGWNMVDSSEQNVSGTSSKPLLAGILAAGMTMLIGNLGTLRMIWHGLIRLGGGSLPLDGISVFNKILWTVSGLIKFVSGEGLGYGYGNWYWDPSRAFPGEPITEFPLFTYLYADLHAHLIAVPLTILAFAFVVHVFLSGQQRQIRWGELLAAAVLGGAVVGALRPTNTWDLPLYLILASLAYLFVGFLRPWVAYTRDHITWDVMLSIKYSIGYMVFLAGTFALYEPFTRWYGAGYTKFNVFTGLTTPFWSYITHWGFFLFILISWYLWETRDWMAHTPARSLLGLKKYNGWIIFLAIVWTAIVIWLTLRPVPIGWFVMLMLAWAGILILRKETGIQKKAVLFLFSTALFITLFVELMALDGDLGRMNTVFKFYMQAWTLMSISSAVALVWLLPAFAAIWTGRIKDVWFGLFWFMTISVVLFTIFATSGKIKDRMGINAPHTLDGMAYMQSATLHDSDVLMDLSEDYDAIRWMQRNIVGTPVIVEGLTTEYRWGSRFTINTGLPGAVGWNWHQRQQRAILANNEVQERVDAINQFYETENVDQALAFLKTYQVKYIISGQLEAALYPATGMMKFPLYEGVYWETVYQNKNTTIYRVLP